MRWPSLLIAFVFVLGVARAEALTVRDIIELSKSGLSDEILVALIDVERKVFPIDSGTLKQLKEAGVSDRVIVAMVRSGRVPSALSESAPGEPAIAPAAASAAPPPQVVVIEHHEPPPVMHIREVREVVVPVPVYVPVVTRPHRRVDHAVDRPVPIAPFSTIGLPHAPLAIYSPTRRKSDPPYWHEMQQPRKE